MNHRQNTLLRAGRNLDLVNGPPNIQIDSGSSVQLHEQVSAAIRRAIARR